MHFIMSKLTVAQKKEIYNKRKEGYTYSKISKEYEVNINDLKYLVRLIDFHGIDILRTDKNRYYPPKIKEEIINEVLSNNQSVNSTAIKNGLPSPGLLVNWIKSYKENGYVIVEKARGRSPTMTKNHIPIKKYEDMTAEEKVKYLENKNLYLEAENEYLKKLRAVVQARKDQQPKKK